MLIPSTGLWTIEINSSSFCFLKNLTSIDLVQTVQKEQNNQLAMARTLLQLERLVG
jgi:hypothetical protein